VGRSRREWARRWVRPFTSLTLLSRSRARARSHSLTLTHRSLRLSFFCLPARLHIDGISTRSQARFFDYAALVFEKLRRLWGIDAASYLDSLGLESLIRHLMLGTLTSFSEAGSEGKAGGLFYFSSDNHYMLKTIREDEHKMLRQILPAYYDHWRHASEATPGVDPDDGDGESGGGPRKPKGWTSLLCRYCGLHSVTFAPRAKVRSPLRPSSCSLARSLAPRVRTSPPHPRSPLSRDLS